QKMIVAVDRGKFGPDLRGLPVSAAGDEQPMQQFQRSSAFEERRRQPVEKLRVSGGRTHSSEIVGRVDNAAAEVILPDAIHHRSPGENVSRIGDPAGKCRAATSLIVYVRKLEPRPQTVNAGQRSRLGGGLRLIDVPAT